MKQRMKIFLASLGLISATLLSTTAVTGVSAVNPYPNCGAHNAQNSSVCKAGDTDNVFNVIKRVVEILLYVTGTVSVIMIIVGGIRYVTSAGDSNGVAGAKNTIIYAVVGLVVSSMAYAIVNFVLTRI